MIGVTGMPFSKEIRLERILGFHYSAVGQSHFPRVIDVLLGSLRFALNAFTRQDEKKMETAERLLKLISPLFVWGTESGRVLEISFILSPKVVKVDEYKERYLQLRSFLEKTGIPLQQQIH